MTKMNAAKKARRQAAMRALLIVIVKFSKATSRSFLKSPFAISILSDLEKSPSSSVGQPKLLNGLLHIDIVRLSGLTKKTLKGWFDIRSSANSLN